MIGAPSAYASKAYWTADDTAIPSDMRGYHLFIDGVNPLWGQNGTDNKRTMELTHDGLELCLNDWSKENNLCHKIIVTPSAFNATYYVGFFVLPKSANQSQLGIDLNSKYHGIGVGVGLGNGHFDIDKLYQDVETARYCIEDHHSKYGTDEFNECFKLAS
jgi:hypothetical protein